MGLLHVCLRQLLVQLVGNVVTTDLVASIRNSPGVLHRTPSWVAWSLVLGFAAASPAQLAAQDRVVPTIPNEQMRRSATLRLVSPLDDVPTVLGEASFPVSADTSGYNWTPGWIGLGIGAAVGVGVGALAPGESGEGVYAPYMVAGAVVFGVLGFFVGLAIGNH